MNSFLERGLSGVPPSCPNPKPLLTERRTQCAAGPTHGTCRATSAGTTAPLTPITYVKNVLRGKALLSLCFAAFEHSVHAPDYVHACQSNLHLA